MNIVFTESHLLPEYPDRLSVEARRAADRSQSGRAGGKVGGEEGVAQSLPRTRDRSRNIQPGLHNRIYKFKV